MRDRRDSRGIGARSLEGLAGALAIGFTTQSIALCLDPGSPLRLPGFWDRVVVLVVGIILIGGLLVLLNGLRRRADRRELGE